MTKRKKVGPRKTSLVWHKKKKSGLATLELIHPAVVVKKDFQQNKALNFFKNGYKIKY